MVILFGTPLPSFPCEVSRNEVSTRWRLVDQATYFDLSHKHRRRSMYTVEQGELLLLAAA